MPTEEETPAEERDVLPEIMAELNSRLRLFDVSRIGKPGFGKEIECGDGRANKKVSGESKPEIRIFGGGFGVLANTLAFLDANGLGSRKNYEIAKTVVEEVLGGEITFHTDTHSQGGLRCEGCGHAKNFLMRSQDYGLSADAARYLKEVVVGLTEENMAVYEGSHEEAAIVVIEGNFTIDDVEQISHQIFVHNKGIQDEILRRIVEALHRVLPELKEKVGEDGGRIIVELAQAQTDETVKSLSKARDLAEAGQIIVVKTGGSSEPIIEKI